MTLKVEGDRLYFGTGYWDIGETNGRTLEVAINAALAASQGAQHHMESCRALLKVPEDEVLYGAIKELQEQLDVERKRYNRLVEDWQKLEKQNLEIVNKLAAEREIKSAEKQILLDEISKNKTLVDALRQIGLLADSGDKVDPTLRKLEAIALRCEKELANVGTYPLPDGRTK